MFRDVLAELRTTQEEEVLEANRAVLDAAARGDQATYDEVRWGAPWAAVVAVVSRLALSSRRPWASVDAAPWRVSLWWCPRFSGLRGFSGRPLGGTPLPPSLGHENGESRPEARPSWNASRPGPIGSDVDVGAPSRGQLWRFEKLEFFRGVGDRTSSGSNKVPAHCTRQCVSFLALSSETASPEILSKVRKV